jgi:hypothetical protein
MVFKKIIIREHYNLYANKCKVTPFLLLSSSKNNLRSDGDSAVFAKQT